MWQGRRWRGARRGTMDKRSTEIIAKVGAAILIAVLILSTLLLALQ